jgi:hypothetical protein
MELVGLGTCDSEIILGGNSILVEYPERAQCQGSEGTVPETAKTVDHCLRTIGSTHDPDERKAQHEADGKGTKAWLKWDADSLPDAGEQEVPLRNLTSGGIAIIIPTTRLHAPREFFPAMALSSPCSKFLPL